MLPLRITCQVDSITFVAMICFQTVTVENCTWCWTLFLILTHHSDNAWVSGTLRLQLTMGSHGDFDTVIYLISVNGCYSPGVPFTFHKEKSSS